MVLDTVEIKKGSAENTAIDDLTNKGSLIEAVIATHPFHTLYFAPFNELYPGLTYYGTPRHLRNITSISWAGDLQEEAVRSKWENEGVFLRIPAGADFVNPPENNHFIGVFVFHAASKTIFIDDTLCYWSNLSWFATWFLKNNTLDFHLTTFRNGLYPTPEAPLEFLAWIRQLLVDWDFENICTAHTGNVLGSGKAQLSILVEASASKFQHLSEKNKKLGAGK